MIILSSFRTASQLLIWPHGLATEQSTPTHWAPTNAPTHWAPASAPTHWAPSVSTHWASTSAQMQLTASSTPPRCIIYMTYILLIKYCLTQVLHLLHL